LMVLISLYISDGSTPFGLVAQRYRIQRPHDPYVIFQYPT
jgi:hypothetical protein